MDEGGLAEFRCEIDANPSDAKTVQWELPHRPQQPGRNWLDRSQTVTEDGVSILRLSGLERSDMGEVICLVSNGVKNVKKKANTYLIVNRKLYIYLLHFFSIAVDIVVFDMNIRTTYLRFYTN